VPDFATGEVPPSGGTGQLPGPAGRQLAEAINVVPSTVSQWESGKRTPHLKDVERIEEVLGTNGYLKRLLIKWVSREISPEWLEWLGVEETATELLWFEENVIPGLLQTEDYARAVLPDEALVSQRLERQQLLEQGNPPTLQVLLDESVLYRKIGSAKIMADQLNHLADMAEREDVFIHIIPFSADACAKFTGPFILATTVEGNQVAYQDGALRGSIMESPADLAAFRRKWARFMADALPARESIELIRKTVSERWPTS
jgi:transcriptional regulator with XRE-family HTH domain